LHIPRKNVFRDGAESTLPAPTPAQIKARIRNLFLSKEKEDYLKGLELFETNSFSFKEIFPNRSKRQMAHENMKKAIKQREKILSIKQDGKQSLLPYTNHTGLMTVLRGHSCS
jgi:hypothetical protein